MSPRDIELALDASIRFYEIGLDRGWSPEQMRPLAADVHELLRLQTEARA